jgi:hypothetical protein
LWNPAGCEIMLSWLNMKCYVDWIGCDRKISRPIGWNVRISTDVIGWCHDLIWGDMSIVTDGIWCCLDQIYIAMCIGKNVSGIFHDQFEVLCGLEQKIWVDVMT